MADKYNAVVVGGGPSGSIAAKTLAAGGVKVLLVEKNFKRIKPCGGSTPSRSFEEFALPLNEIGRKIKSLAIISPAGLRIGVSLEKGYLAMVERGSFDRALRMQAVEAGADLAEAEFLSINERQKKICITVIEKGKERDISSDFLIAADGVNSRIGKAIGLESLPCIYTIQEEIDVRSAGDLGGLETCEFWFGSSHAPHSYSWIFPKKDYVDIGTGSINGKLLKDLMKNFKIRCRINGDGRQKVYRLPLKCRDSLVMKNILLVGDAAGLVMPLCYEGIYYAMRSGKMAAEAIIRDRPDDYEKQWNKIFRKQFKLMGKLGKYFLRSDISIEQMIRLHKRKQVQEAAIRIWFEKEMRPTGFLSYINFFRKFLN